MHINYSSYVYDGFYIWRTNFPGPIESVISKFTCIYIYIYIITCWNARGYLLSIPYMRQLLTECDILAISEHWVYENRLACLSDITNTHTCFGGSSRLASAEDYGNGRGQGGIALFWDKRINGISVVSDIVLDRACAIRLQTQLGAVLYFVSVYLPSMVTQVFLRWYYGANWVTRWRRQSNTHGRLQWWCW